MTSTFRQDHRDQYQNVDDEIDTRELLNEHDDLGQRGRLHLASVEEKKRLWWRNASITAACIALWFLFATLLSVYNKWMFSPDRYAFPFPLFVTCLHMWIQFGLAALVRALWPTYFRPPEKPTPKQYGQKVAPTAIATCIDIGLSNLSLKAITLTFYTMVKNSSLIFVLIFAFLFRLEVFSFRLIGVIFLILVGVILMVATETSFSLPGFLLVLSASACGGLRWSLTQLLLRKDSKHGMGLETPPAALFWMAPVMGIVLGSLSMIVEGWIRVFQSSFFDGFGTSLMTGLYILMPGTLAFCMVISEFYIIQRAGVVPMSVAGIFKEVATISVSAWIFGDHLTPLNLTGAVVAFCGIILFTYHKYLKSIESTVPLDAHGNPLLDADIEDDTSGVIVLEDTRAFSGRDYTLDSVQHTLFSVGPDSDSDAGNKGGSDDQGRGSEERKGRDQLRTQRTNGGPYVAEDTRSVVRESLDVERLWYEDHQARTR